MKKQTFDSLNLDKETIAKLDEAQLNLILGGANDDDADETACTSAGTCGPATCGAGTSCGPFPPFRP